MKRQHFFSCCPHDWFLVEGYQKNQVQSVRQSCLTSCNCSDIPLLLPFSISLEKVKGPMPSEGEKLILFSGNTSLLSKTMKQVNFHLFCFILK